MTSATPEFDYPKGADNVFSYYAGTGGVPVSGLLRRLLFSFYFKDINLLVTQNIVDKSKIMIRRNIVDRIAYLAGEPGESLSPAERAQLDELRTVLSASETWEEPDPGLEDRIVAAIGSSAGHGSGTTGYYLGADRQARLRNPVKLPDLELFGSFCAGLGRA